MGINCWKVGIAPKDRKGWKRRAIRARKFEAHEKARKEDGSPK